MASNKPTRGIGPVPEGLGEGLTDFLHQLRRQALDVMAGRTAVSGSGSSSGTGGSTIIIGGPGTGGTVEPDLTPPPTPTGVNVVAGIDFVGVTSDPPVFSQGHGYLATLVYGKKYAGTGPLPTFSADSKQFEFTGEVGTFPTDPATQWHIWVKWKTKDGVVSLSPAGGTNGFQVTTGQDVTKLLAALAAKIRNEQLDPTSNFIYRVNSFTIAPPAGTTGVANILPFSVLTVPTLTAAGELLPAGVYMEAAYIKNLDVALGRFQNAFITNAMIVSVSASRLTSGVISVGNYIQSSNYVPGASGWKIHGNGAGEFRGLQIGGDSYFDGQVTIRAPGGRIILQSGGKLAAGDITPDAGWLNSNVGLPVGATINADPGFETPAAWSISANVGYGPANGSGAVGGRCVFAASGLDQLAFTAKTYPINRSRQYELSANMQAGPGNNRRTYLVVRMFDAAGVEITGSATGWGEAYAGYPADAIIPGDSVWRRYGGRFGLNVAGRPIPAAAVTCQVGVWFQYSGEGGSAVTQAAQDLKLIDVTEAAAAQSAADAAATAASNAGINASNALTRLAAIDSDGVLSRGEKAEIIKARQAAVDEGAGIYAQAGALGITAERAAYSAAYDSLMSYLSGLSPSYADTSQDTIIVPAVDRAKWADYYRTRQAVLNAIAAKAATTATWAGTTGEGRPLDNASKVVDLGEGNGPGQRGRDDPPNFYAPGVTRQFKASSAVGLGGADDYLTLETVIQYQDATGGACYQYAYRGTTTWRRWGQCGASSWAGSWVQDLDRNAYTGDLNATHGATLGVNVGGKITQLNASTLIDTAALGGALVGELIAENFVLTQLSRAQNGLPSGAALSGRRIQSIAGGLEFYRDNGTKSIVLVA